MKVVSNQRLAILENRDLELLICIEGLYGNISFCVFFKVTVLDAKILGVETIRLPTIFGQTITAQNYVTFYTNFIDCADELTIIGVLVNNTSTVSFQFIFLFHLFDSFCHIINTIFLTSNTSRLIKVGISELGYLSLFFLGIFFELK